MLEQLLDLLKIAGILFVFVSAWIISIAVVFRDINRRSLNGLEQFLWLAVVALLPLIGFLIYWVARLLTRLLLSDPRPPEDPRLRMTAVKPAPNSFPRAPLYQGPRQEPLHQSTIAAAQPPMPAQPVSQQSYPPQAQSQQPYPQQAQPQQSYPPQSYPGLAGYALVAMEGPYMGGKFLITQFPARIGRGNSVTVQLNSDQGISRQHAEIYTESNGQAHIRDLNSTHGTYVNGRRIIDSHLSPGDRVTLGQSTFVFSEHRG